MLLNRRGTRRDRQTEDARRRVCRGVTLTFCPSSHLICDQVDEMKEGKNDCQQMTNELFNLSFIQVPKTRMETALRWEAWEGRRLA